MSAAPARLTLSLPVCGPAAAEGPRPIVELAMRAEELGVDAVAVADHVAIGPDTSGYPFGVFPLPPDAPFLEPLSLLMAIATVTRSVRLTTGILIAPLRPAPLLAKTAATIDVMSAGRLELGVGVGWHAAEYDACGIDFHRRGIVLDEVIGACRALWARPGASYDSASVSFESLSSIPLPVQRPLPVLFAGSTHARNLARLAASGDGWITVMGAEPAAIADSIDRIRAARRSHGRDGSPFIVRAELTPRTDARGRPDVDATLEGIPELVAAGVTDVQFPMPYFVSDPLHAHHVLERLVAGWRALAARRPPGLDHEVPSA
jgi:probable F420-dependent oxidoreductase